MPRPTTQIATVAALLLTATAAVPAWAAPKDDLRAAVTKLADAKSYTFTTTVEGGGPGAGSGKIEKGGYTSLTVTVRNAEINIVTQGDRVAVQTDDGWKGSDEMQDAKRPQKNAMAAARNFRTPAEDAAELLADATEVKAGDAGTYTAELPEAAAKKWVPLNRVPRRPATNPAGGDAAAAAPQVKDAKAAVTFTLADGALAKMALHVSGTVTRGGNDRDVDRTITTEIKDVDKTTPDVPPEAKAKLDGATTRPSAKP